MGVYWEDWEDWCPVEDMITSTLALILGLYYRIKIGFGRYKNLHKVRLPYIRYYLTGHLIILP